MKNLLFYSIIVCFISASCQDENDNTPVTVTTPPDNFLIDIDEDGVNDFSVEYYTLQSLDVPTSYMSNIGAIYPLNENQALYKSPNGYLFLEPNDTIMDSVSSPLNWFSFGGDVISISWDINSGWDDNWEVISALNEYYFAFKLQDGVSSKLGWMKLDFNLNTGEIEVIDKSITSSNFLIIN